MRSQKDITRILDLFNDLTTQYEEMAMLCEMALEDSDMSLANDFEKGMAKLDKQLEEASLAALFKGEYDTGNAILSIHAGQWL